ncbi:MAG TPA: DUF397 domain-containing protein [Micromonosporaceae bacterium]|nr:DUF397 domain-containing protein [Micromonosporaceae bacterium]
MLAGSDEEVLDEPEGHRRSPGPTIKARPRLATAKWFKASRSGGQNNCVEVAFLNGGNVAVRDSKARGSGPVLVFTPAEWDAFLGGAKDGEFEEHAWKIGGLATRTFLGQVRACPV